MTVKNIYFLFSTIIMIAIYYPSLRELAALSLSYDELYSHIVLIPLISIYFMFTERKNIFSSPGSSSAAGIPLIILGSMLALTGTFRRS